jgi:hypothetical protein
MQRKPQLFLDLEGTIINNFHDFQFIHSSFWKYFFQTYLKIPAVNIFSYAISSDIDKAYTYSSWDSIIKPSINVDIQQVLSTPDITQLIQNNTLSPIQDHYQLTQFMDKFNAFLNCFRLDHNSDIFLIDDLIPDVSLQFHSTNTTIDFINISTLLKDIHHHNLIKHYS